MTDRERLADLITRAVGGCDLYWADVIADYLLENGVIVPPCKVDDTVYEIQYNHCCTCPDFDYYSINEKRFHLDMLNEINKTVFLTREEAEQSLKERENKTTI